MTFRYIVALITNLDAPGKPWISIKVKSEWVRNIKGFWLKVNLGDQIWNFSPGPVSEGEKVHSNWVWSAKVVALKSYIWRW